MAGRIQYTNMSMVMQYFIVLFLVPYIDMICILWYIGILFVLRKSMVAHGLISLTVFN